MTSLQGGGNCRQNYLLVGMNPNLVGRDCPYLPNLVGRHVFLTSCVSSACKIHMQ